MWASVGAWVCGRGEAPSDSGPVRSLCKQSLGFEEAGFRAKSAAVAPTCRTWLLRPHGHPDHARDSGEAGQGVVGEPGARESSALRGGRKSVARERRLPRQHLVSRRFNQNPPTPDQEPLPRSLRPSTRHQATPPGLCFMCMPAALHILAVDCCMKYNIMPQEGARASLFHSYLLRESLPVSSGLL